MELSERLVQVKSTAKEEELLEYTPDDIVFLFGDVIRPVGLILNHNDPIECHVLFPPAAPMSDIFKLTENPSWVGTHMKLGLHKPQSGILQIVNKLLQDKALEEGEEYEYIPIKPLDPTGSGIHSTPKKGENPDPAGADVLANQLKQMTTQELQQIISALQLEMRGRQDASLGSAQDVSTVLQTLLKEGALRTNIPKLSAFSGEIAKGEVSFEQWSYELQTLCKSYSDSALREGIQHSLRGAAADAVGNMGLNVPLDIILKKFTIIYGKVKSFDVLMKDFYRAAQGEDETISSFATRIEGLPFQIRDRFPNQLPHQEEQRLLKDHLFHGSGKSICDSVKYCFADTTVDYMHFLEEYRKSEDEWKAGQAKAASRVKAKAAAATLPPPRKRS